MNKLINILAVFIGVVYFTSGILKLLGYLDTTTINFFGFSFWYRNFTHPIFVVIFNFILGGALTYYSISILKFHSKASFSKELDGNKTNPELLKEPLTQLQKITGALSILLGLFFGYKAIALTAVVAGSEHIINLIPFFAMMLFIWTKAVIPIVLFGITTMKNNRITARLHRIEQAKKRAKIQERKMANLKR